MTMATVSTTANQRARKRKMPARVLVSNVWPIHSEEDYWAAEKIVSNLALYPEGSLSPEDQARLDVFSELIAAYDAKYVDPFFKEVSALDTLRHLVAEHGMSESDLGRLLGNRQTGHDILSGKRELSKAHIRILSKHFCLPADAFFD